VIHEWCIYEHKRTSKYCTKLAKLFRNFNTKNTSKS